MQRIWSAITEEIIPTYSYVPADPVHDHALLQNATEKVNSLKEMIKEHYHELYEFDPHVNCLIALQRERKLKKGRKLKFYEDSLLLTLVRYVMCLGTQWTLLFSIFFGRVFEGKKAEQLETHFLFAAPFACWAFVAQAAAEWKEILHLWDMAAAAPDQDCKVPAFISVFLVAIVPKVSFALFFSFLAPFEFLDADHTSEIILNCTGLVFLLQVDNELFKASGGRLETREFDDLAGRVQKSYFPIKLKHLQPREPQHSEDPEDPHPDEGEDEFEMEFERRRKNQRFVGFAVSFAISLTAYIIWRQKVSHSAPTSTPSPIIFH